MPFPPRRLWGALLACALLLLVPALPAYAHDQLKSSSPAKGAEVTSLEEIELEYTAGVKFPFVVLHDAAGNEIALSKPRLAGPKVSAEPAQPLEPGEYVIAWRVVSSDGHPIEGEIPFSVKGSPSPSASPSPTGQRATAGGPPSAAAQPSTAAGPSAAGDSAAAERPAAAGVPGWIWGGLAVLVVLGAFVLIRTSRRGPDREDVNAD